MKKTKQSAARKNAKRKTARATNATAIKKEKRIIDRTAAMKAAFLKIYSSRRCNVSKTAKKIGIDRKTYYRWMESDQAFAAAANEAFEAQVDHVEDKLHILIDQMEPSAIFFFLKTRAKNRGYVEKSEIGGNVNLTHNLSISDLKKSMDSYKKQ